MLITRRAHARGVPLLPLFESASYSNRRGSFFRRFEEVLHMKVLVVGQGGREHALVWKLAKSPLVSQVFCAPGNAGTALDATNVDINATDIDRLVKFAQAEQIGLTVVGPEAALVAGIVDAFEKQGLRVFGPSKA